MRYFQLLCSCLIYIIPAVSFKITTDVYPVLIKFNLTYGTVVELIIKKNLVPWGTDGRLPLSDLDLDLRSGHTAYRRASVIDLYLRSKFH